MNIVIIKYNAGNTLSVSNALLRLGIEAIVTDDVNVINAADKVILPGVGAAGAAMQSLQVSGLDTLIPQLTQPILGICLGMQLMCAHSEEDDTKCLGIFSMPVKRFTGNEKVPHTGWNKVYDLQSALFSGIAAHECMYFVHSYYVPLCSQAISTTDYMGAYSSAIRCNNFYGVQFHPEKSGPAGQQLLSNFLAL